jgi:hypothetical protein
MNRGLGREEIWGWQRRGGRRMISGVPGVVLINRARLGRGERDEDPIWVRGASAPCAVLAGPLLFSIIAPRPLAVAFFGRCIFFEKKRAKTSTHNKSWRFYTDLTTLILVRREHIIFYTIWKISNLNMLGPRYLKCVMVGSSITEVVLRS